jgi:DNA repair exonuclease SbcCD ATPase subunit
MQILSVEIENFGSYESSTLNLQDRGLLLVEGENRDQGGSNGAGKTTIFESICWAIFGRTVSGLRGDDVLRSETKDCRVELHLGVDGRTVVATRHRKHSQFANQLHLSIDGVDSRAASDKETQTRLERLLQLDWNSFVSVVLFPQGQQGIASWTDAEQKSVLDTILNLDRFIQARERVMKWLTKDKVRCQNLEISIGQTEVVLAAADEDVAALKKRDLEFGEETELLLRTKQSMIAHHTAKEPQPVQDLTDEIAALEREIEQNRQEDVHNMVEQIDHRLHVLRTEQASEMGRLQLLRQQSSQKVLDPEAELAKVQDCPSCGQILPEEARERLYSTFSERAHRIRVENEDRQQDISKIADNLVKTDAQVLELQELMEKTRAKLVDVSSLQRQLQAAHSRANVGRTEYAHWETELARHQVELRQIRERKSPFLDLIERAHENIQQQKDKLVLQRKELEPLKQDIAHLEFWKTGFGNGGVKSLLMSTVTPFLNERANAYMGDLSNDAASIQISTQKQIKSGEFRDKLSFSVTYPHAGDNYAARSGGEARRADLAILFALGDLAANRATAPVALRLLDEPFESLDALGCEQVINLLHKHVLPRAKTVLVMSHNETLKALFEKRITVIKEGGVSRIVDPG